MSSSVLARVRARLEQEGGLDLGPGVRRALAIIAEEERRGLCWTEGPGGRRCINPAGHLAETAWHDDGRAAWFEEGDSPEVVEAVIYCGATNDLRSCALPDGHEGPHEWPAYCGTPVEVTPGVHARCALGKGHGGYHRAQAERCPSTLRSLRCDGVKSHTGQHWSRDGRGERWTW